MRLFAFVAQYLHDQIKSHLEGLVSEICDNYGSDINMIVADQRRIKLQRQRLARSREARADDRTATALRIIARTTCVCVEMQHLQLNIGHHECDNGSGVVILGKEIELINEIMDRARDFCESFVGMACLDFMGTDPLLLGNT
jgi:hypothetical protein